MNQEFRERNLKTWETLLTNVFNGPIPTTQTWTDIPSIVRILRTIGGIDSSNHTFFPSSGGQDLTSAMSSTEPGCIELVFDKRSVHIVKPAQLTFESFGPNQLEWAYFRLDLMPLNPSGVYSSLSLSFEELLEVSPGKYQDRSDLDSGAMGEDENGNPLSLPKSARIVTRQFSGSFVTFAKGSIYNETPSTYDARHNSMTPQAFRQHIERAIKYLDAKSRENEAQ